MSNDALIGIRAQRAEVEALLAYTHAKEAEARVLAWWRLQRARQARLQGMAPAAAARLSPLPAPPPGALARWQSWALRFGWLRLEGAAPPRPLAKALAGDAAAQPRAR